MKFDFAPNFKKNSELRILPVWEGSTPAADFESMDIQQALKDFKGKRGQTSLAYDGKNRLMLLGLGKQHEASVEALRRAYSCAVRFLQKRDFKDIEVLFPTCKQKQEFFRGMAEGIAISNYAFSYKTNNEPLTLLDSVTFVGISKLDFADEILTIAENVHFVRDLVNSNADDKINLLTDKAKKLHPKVQTTIYDKKWITKEKMGLILAVNRASSLEPVLIQASYKGNPESNDHVVLVGKGITYDTGGLSLKPTSNMLSMKSDMGGAATVLGAVKAAAELGLKINVTALMPVTENSIGSDSYKLGDVYTSFSGKTVEVNNTDAEGRLVLADAISYAAKRLKPTFIIDLATLTGAVVVALGEEIAGLFTSDEDLADSLLTSSDETDELLWRLPVHDDYKIQLKSEIADMVNAGGREAGSITAALFLQEFTEGLPWAHIDIAGPAFMDKPKFYNSLKGTGYGVRLLTDFLKRESR